VAVIVCGLIGLPLAVTLIPGMSWLDNFASTLKLVLLIAWYVGAARSQARYVKDRFGTSYPRRGWGNPCSLRSVYCSRTVLPWVPSPFWRLPGPRNSKDRLSLEL
jgi:hypothetical protein